MRAATRSSRRAPLAAYGKICGRVRFVSGIGARFAAVASRANLHWSPQPPAAAAAGAAHTQSGYFVGRLGFCSAAGATCRGAAGGQQVRRRKRAAPRMSSMNQLSFVDVGAGAAAERRATVSLAARPAAPSHEGRAAKQSRAEIICRRQWRRRRRPRQL